MAAGYPEEMVFEMGVPVPATLRPPPSDPVPVPPARRPESVRRTSTLLMSWPEGLAGDLHLYGDARDLLTPLEGEAAVLRAARLHAVTDRLREILSIEAEPAASDVQRLVGCRAGSNLRTAIAEQLPEEVEAGTPLHLLLDDLAGSTLISGFAMALWADEFPEIRSRMAGAHTQKVMRDICSGFRHGSSALTPEGTIRGISMNTPEPGPLADPADALSWHHEPSRPPMAMRRARRIDVWGEDGELHINAMFRDSCWDPQGRENVVHEYELLGRADAAGTLRAMTAVPKVLPYAECPLAAPNASWLEGSALRAMRSEVLQRLRSTDCCTHLNDGLRSLAEVPVLAAALEP